MKCNSFIRYYSLNSHYPLKTADMVNKTNIIMYQLINCVDNITVDCSVWYMPVGYGLCASQPYKCYDYFHCINEERQRTN